ncbi:acyltransferase family protein [Hymenobacter lapidarius]|uniref:acyltransferase family protein n=1 Tax=Hymenobacter lapidarius TaxID=1908237 RepID=UPI000F7A7818|nr:acyltransferase [Hymenobacter lapidarius]
MNTNFLPFIDPKRNYGLDILRAVAILTVLMLHASPFIPEIFRPFYQWFLLDGVSIFFVLSGFLIGGILLRTLETKPATMVVLWHFWLMRWFRTVPPYFFALFILIILVNPQNLLHMLWEWKRMFLFVQNFASPPPPIYTEAWSLSVEEWFYLLLGSIVVAITRISKRPKSALLLTAIIFLVGSTSLRLNQFLLFPPTDITTWDENYRSIVVMRLDGLMYGVIGAYWMRYSSASWLSYSRQKAVVGIALLFLCVMPYSSASFGIFQSVFSFSLTGIGTLLLLPFTTQIKSGKGIAYKFFTYTSLISYSMYLLNGSIIISGIIWPMLAFIGPLPGWLNCLVGYSSCFVLTYFFGLMMYQTIELGALKLRRRLVE